MKAVRRDEAAAAAPQRRGPSHRHTTHSHEHEFEPVRGLPELLPEGERILWQGSPDWRVLARRAFHLRQFAAWFTGLLALRAGFMLADGASVGQVADALLWLLPLAATSLGFIALLAWMSARNAVYTITNRRVVMRIGIVLTLAYNIPFKRIVAAGLHREARGTGDVALTLAKGERIAFLHLWPHTRPWHVQQPEPLLRAVPDAENVARLLTEAWSASTGLAAVSAATPRHAAAAQPANPALAAR